MYGLAQIVRPVLLLQERVDEQVGAQLEVLAPARGLSLEKALASLG